METLFSSQMGNFFQAVIHIGSFCEPMSYALATRFEKDIKSLTSKKFQYYNVENLSNVVGCPAHVEVHGECVFADEKALKTISPGIFRKALLAGASRQSWGGKRRYDFVNMNVSLLTGYVCGLGAIYLGRSVLPFRRYPLSVIPLGLIGFALGVPFAKIVWRTAGIANFFVDHHCIKAITALNCQPCLEEVMQHVRNEIETRKVQQWNQNFYDTYSTELIKAKELDREKAFVDQRCIFHEEKRTLNE